MHSDTNKNKIILTFCLGSLFILLQVAFSYNSFVSGKEKFGVISFLLVILALVAYGYGLLLALKVSNSNLINEYIQSEVSKERAKILKDLEKNDTESDIQEDGDQQIEEKIREISLAGNFKTIESLGAKILKNFANTLNLAQGIFYIKKGEKEEFDFVTGYALTDHETVSSFKTGENLTGQVAQTREISYISDIPEDYFEIESGLGKSKPKELIFVPIVFDSEVLAVLELASLNNLNDLDKKVLEGALIQVSKKVSQTIKS